MNNLELRQISLELQQISLSTLFIKNLPTSSFEDLILAITMFYFVDLLLPAE